MSVYYADDSVTLHLGDVVAEMSGLEPESVDCIVTSPPYFWMRDYGVEGQIGLERTPADYVDVMLAVSAEMLRVLKPTGTLWLNIGDAYSQRKAVRGSSHQEGLHGVRGSRPSWRESRAAGRARMSNENIINGSAIAEKSLMMLPERIAIGMIEQGWILRNRITWEKTFCTPDPAPDRLPGRSEPIMMFSRSPRYAWDGDALRSLTADAGDVWRLPASSGGGKHTASYATALPERCITAGCAPGGTVLDPFSGSGTTGAAAIALGHRYIGIDLNSDYLDESLVRLGLSREAGVA